MTGVSPWDPNGRDFPNIEARSIATGSRHFKAEENENNKKYKCVFIAARYLNPIK